MNASGAPFQLVTTFNEWGEGTAVESATEWASASGYGAYLDVLHDNGSGSLPATATATSVTTATAVPPTATAVPPTATATKTASATATKTATPTPTATAGSGGTVTVLAAGDIASCSSSGDESTAKLLDGQTGTVLTLGDNAYESGSAAEFANCYDPSWGRAKGRTEPAVGNHEYNTAGASGYFGYFGAAAGAPDKGYYSFELGGWHLIALNSNCSQVGGCAAGSPQEQWLRADLAAHPASCTLAYWHHPRFNSGASHGNNTAVSNFWDALYLYGADVILNGHEHVYERFAPQTPAAVADPTAGIRQFTVGTGGASHYTFGTIQPNSEVRDGTTYGVLKLTLHATSYDWQFVPVAGGTFTDSGTGSCH